MIKRYCFNCGKDSYFSSSGVCSVCSQRRNLEIYNKEREDFNKLSLELKIDYLFDKLYYLEKNKANREVYY